MYVSISIPIPAMKNIASKGGQSGSHFFAFAATNETGVDN